MLTIGPFMTHGRLRMHPARLPPRASRCASGLVQAVVQVGQFMMVLDKTICLAN
jgi:hypothetical protein